MHILQQYKHALTRGDRKDATRRVTIIAVLAVVAFTVGALVPWNSFLVGASLATLMLVAAQLTFGLLDGRESSSTTRVENPSKPQTMDAIGLQNAREASTRDLASSQPQIPHAQRRPLPEFPHSNRTGTGHVQQQNAATAPTDIDLG